MKILLIIGKSVFVKGDTSKGYRKNFLDYNANVGNYLYYYALEKYLCNGCNSNENITIKNIDYLRNFDEINNNFDMIIFATDNKLHRKCKDILVSYAECFSKIKKPVYVINLGLQTNIRDKEVLYIKKIKSEIVNFIEAIYQTGGTFALRGNYTAKIFDKLGFNDYTVTGCPSFFINGKNGFNLRKHNKIKKIAINGTKIFKDKFINKNFTEYDTYFIDQDRFYRILFEREKYPIKYSNILLFWRFNPLTIRFLKEGRIKLFCDIPLWQNFLKENHFDFSFGTRIHGNIISLLSGIPSMVYCKDLRTLELAEYFEIPHITKINKKMDLQELYNVCDYTKMLSNYDKKLDIMQNFFDKHKIPAKIKCENDLFEEKVNEFFFLRV